MDSLYTYDSPSEQADRLAASVAEELKSAIQSKGRALMAVAGGTTPAPFFERLSRIDLDWTKVIVTTTDERVVPSDTSRSNALLVRDNLMVNNAAGAKFLPLYDDEPSAESAAENASSNLLDLLPLDVCVLGMGADMHTASLFPGTPGLEEAISPDCPDLVLSLIPPTADEPRLTLTLPVLLGASHLHILIIGSDKLDALNKAQTINSVLEAPITSIFPHKGLKIHYAEKAG